MFFTRTHSFNSPLSKNELTNELVGRHVNIHNIDFEVVEKDGSISIIPHAEQVDAIKTLPVTYVDMKEAGNKTKVRVTSEMRRIDSGGPFLVVLFCLFLFIAAAALFVLDKNDINIAYTLFSVGALFAVVFCVRMQMGYFDYVRKVRAYVKSKGAPAASTMSMPVLQA